MEIEGSHGEESQGNDKIQESEIPCGAERLRNIFGVWGIQPKEPYMEHVVSTFLSSLILPVLYNLLYDLSPPKN